MSMNGKADFRRKRVEVQGGQASNTNFRGIKTILNVPNLRGKSDVTEGAKEARRKPIARSSKKNSLKIVEKVLDLFVASSKLANISKKGQNEDI